MSSLLRLVIFFFYSSVGALLAPFPRPFVLFDLSPLLFLLIDFILCCLRFFNLSPACRSEPFTRLVPLRCCTLSLSLFTLSHLRLALFVCRRTRTESRGGRERKSGGKSRGECNQKKAGGETPEFNDGAETTRVTKG